MSKSFTGPHKIQQTHRNFETHQRQDKKMGRAPCCDKNGLKKGPWTPEEDLKLINYIQKHGPGNWRNLPQNAGLQRCGKSCRLRWTNYLRPDIKRGRFSFEEEETIIQLHSVLGNKWATIAARLPGRTDNEIKNYWNTHIKKRLLRMGIDPVTHTPRLDLLDLSSIIGSTLCNPSSLFNLSALLSTTTTQALFNPDLLRLASTILSLKQENPELLNFLYNNINLQENQLFNNMHQNQVLPSLQPNLDHQFQNHIQESGFSTDQITPQAPVSADDQQGLSSNNVTSTTKLTTQENITSSTLAENLVADIDLPQSSYFQNLLDYSNKDFSFDSLLSTPSSSPTPLNSSSTTNINSGAEDERESYCSHLLKFEIPESLDISDFL